MRRHYEEDNKTFPADAYSVAGYKGIAFSVWGWAVVKPGAVPTLAHNLHRQSIGQSIERKG